MLRKILLSVLALALARPVVGEVTPKSLSVSQTVTSYSFPSKTKFVLVISDGASTCYYRLFTNRDTPAAATASSTGNLVIKSGESKTYDLNRQTTDFIDGSQGSATSWQSISAICSSGQTATFRIESF
jgi:hypothetical protein